MTKRDFIRRVAEENNVSIENAKAWVDVVFKTLANCVIDNPEVHIYGFGRFEQRIRGAKVGRLPSGEHVHIPPVRKLRFEPSEYIADAVKDGIDSMQFGVRMNRIRALRRGEHVPGFKLKGRELIEIDIPDDYLAPIQPEKSDETEE